MKPSGTRIFSTTASRLLAAAMVVTGFCAAVAAAPAVATLHEAVGVSPAQRATFGDGATALRPFGQGTVIRVDRAYGDEDEDCVLAVTKVEDAKGGVSVTRGVACAH
ncbi:hypothetical protein [Methylosinus sp. Sm6]|uniref:hypothetical protein n=1 Tax=Methylosinus sp. Sm6 TaxID=2866948 RepID=UPI001C99CD6F|nr:hypothetical protein [Methylosinus sp. Sm6]MBY6240971.1 hypothetical protein [Methylosinus sp. Sm6]